MPVLRTNFCFALFLTFTGYAFSAPQTVNILTADAKMAGFGDLVSNWHAAQLLQSQNAGLRVNFYVSSAFNERFEIIKPEFLGRRQSSYPMVINGIRVFWDNFEEQEIKRNRAIDEMLDTLDQPREVCNLAFTTSANNILGQPGGDDDPTFAYYLSSRTLNSTNPMISGTPFLGFLFLLQNTDERFLLIEQPRLMTTTKPRFPLYMFSGALESGSLIISRRPPELNLPGYDLNGNLGFAYSHRPEFRVDYIQRVANVARVNPRHRYVVVLGGNYEMDKMPPLSFRRLAPTDYVHLVKIDTDDTGVMQGNPHDREYYQLVNEAWGPNQLENLYIVRYPQGLPFDITQTVIREANLPVLVSGTMSLSLAVQNDKPFIYEVMPHHRSFSLALHTRFVGHDGSGFEGTQLRNPYQSEILRFVPYLSEEQTFAYPVFDDVLGVVEQARNKTDLFDPDSVVRSARYQRFVNAIRDYRLNLRNGQMLDNVLDYCDRARAHFKTLNKIEPNKKNMKQIILSLEKFKYEQIKDRRNS